MNYTPTFLNIVIYSYQKNQNVSVIFTYLSQEKRTFRIFVSILANAGDNYRVDDGPLTLPYNAF